MVITARAGVTGGGVFRPPSAEQIATIQLNEKIMILFFGISLVIGLLASFYAGKKYYERNPVVLLIFVFSFFIGYISAEIRDKHHFFEEVVFYTAIPLLLMIGTYFGGKNLKIENKK